MKHYTIPFPELELTVQNVLDELGYGSNGPDDYVLERLQNIFEEAKTTVVASWEFHVLKGDVFPDTIGIGSCMLNTGPIIAKQMKGADRFAVFAATAGQAFEDWSHRVKKEDDMLQTYLLDITGTCIVEKAGDLLEKYLEDEIGTLQHTNRFSPGYCNWKLVEQRKLFGLLPENPCEIRLSEVCLMNPIKSISGIIGIGEQVRRTSYSCHLCELESCYKRRLINIKQKQSENKKTV